MIRRAWKPLAAATVLVGTPSYFFYRKQPTFDLAVNTKGPDGKYQMVNHRIPLLSKEIVNARITENAESESKLRPGGILWKRCTATLASNNPPEDAYSNAIIQRDETDPSAAGDLLFFAVMDGHGGTHTSKLLSKVLINAVVLELSNLIGNHSITTESGLFGSLKSAIWSRPSTATPPPSDADPHQVSLAIQNAFTKLDSELINAPLRVLAANVDENSRAKKVLPDLSQHPMALTTMLPAISGQLTIPFSLLFSQVEFSFQVVVR